MVDGSEEDLPIDKTSDSNNKWLTLTSVDGAGQEFISLESCSGETCFTTDANDIKTYTQIASQPIFGFESAAGNTFKTINISTERTFDVVLFILEKDKPQDYDQDKTFSGTIFVETPNNTAHITGRTE